MVDLFSKLSEENCIRDLFPRRSKSELDLVRENIMNFGLGKSAIHVWEKEDDGKLIVVSGYTVKEACRQLKLSSGLSIVIEEENIVRLKFTDINEAQYWRVKHLMSGRHMNSAQRCDAALKSKPVFAEIGTRRMSEGGKGGSHDGHSRWETMRELERTFHVTRKTINMFQCIKKLGADFEHEVLSGDMTVTAGYNRAVERFMRQAKTGSIEDVTGTKHMLLEDQENLDELITRMISLKTELKKLSKSPAFKKKEKESDPLAHQPGDSLDEILAKAENKMLEQADNFPGAEDMERMMDDAASMVANAEPYRIFNDGCSLLEHLRTPKSVGCILPVITSMEDGRMAFIVFRDEVKLDKQFEHSTDGNLEAIATRVLEASHE